MQRSAGGLRFLSPLRSFPLPSRLSMLLALLAGAANVFAFAPFNIWPLQILTMAWVFAQAARHSDSRRNFVLGWIYGFGWTACGVHWLYISMHTYGGMVSWMAALAVGLLALFIGLYSALALSMASALRRRWQSSETTMLLLLLPAMWALTEWARGWIFTGFPWLSAGYAHSVGPLKGYAPLIGVYGLGWIAALTAGCSVIAVRAFRRRQQPIAAKAAAAILVLLGGGIVLHAIDWTRPLGAPIGVRLLQGNVAQEFKFSESALVSTLQYYDAAIRTEPADLIAIPETAIPLLPQQLPAGYLESLNNYAQTSGSHLALGIPLSDAPGAYSNSLIMFAPAAAKTADAEPPAPYRYDKHHLVPFGEFVPLGFHWFVDMMSIPLGDMTRGSPLQRPFPVKDQWVMPNICYEDLFGEEIAAQLAAAWFHGDPPASILLNISNIAWFGDSIALPQHLQISQMRALETGRPMLRATNTGATAVIDPKGRIMEELKPYTAGVLAQQVQGYQGWTPYMLGGNKLILAIALLALLWARLRFKAAGKP